MKQESKTIPNRQDIPKQYQWDLSDLYPDDSSWERDLRELRGLLPQAKKYQGRLAESPVVLLEFFRYEEQLSRLLDKVYTYASMKKDEDNRLSHYQSMEDQAQGLAVEIEAALSFFQPELLAIPESRMALYLQNAQLAPYARLISEITRSRPYTLSGSEEKILAFSGEMAASPSQIFQMLNNADLDFPLTPNEQGQPEKLSHSRYLQRMESPKREVRQAAFQALYETYGKCRNTFAATLASAVKKNIFYARVRNYESALFASLFNDEIPIPVYDRLISTVRKNLPLFFRYLQLRRRLLQLDRLHMYDVYAPLFDQPQEIYSYERAQEIILFALAPLGSEYLSLVERGFSEGWVDVYENQGKTPGAYSGGAYDTKPYILLNYKNNLNSVFTLAHELGHSLHSYLSRRRQPYIYSGYSIFVAEVASTVNESLLVDYLLKTAVDDQARLAILNHFLEEFRGTVFRQTMFAEFEKKIHLAAESAQPLTADSLCQIYYQLNQDYYGAGITDMEIDTSIEMEWARIPHFYSSFYVYKYATGFSAAQALANGILDPDPAKARANCRNYLEFLSSGSSAPPLDLLRAAGVDMTTPAPIEAAMKRFTDMLDQIECLIM
ncbi:MAG: oligoendopeptidase F [Clostridiales bacterium]|jgi:oligoendopeptidase F|nr:oligoendopeptidase F [Clostridiales bacterium]MDR2713557.1 oligoendopeptidase F [Clostridiales bacterium]